MNRVTTILALIVAALLTSGLAAQDRPVLHDGFRHEGLAHRRAHDGGPVTIGHPLHEARERAKAERAFDREFATSIRTELEAIVAGVAEGGSIASASTWWNCFDEIRAPGSNSISGSMPCLRTAFTASLT